MRRKEEEELCLGEFFGGDTHYAFRNKGTKYMGCINCSSIFKNEMDASFDVCPNCYLNTLIYTDTKDALTRLQFYFVKEKIINFVVCEMVEEFLFIDED